MPVRLDLAPQDAVQALFQELEAARSLYRAQKALEDALQRGLQAEDLNPFVADVEAAARDTAEAATVRARWFQGPGSMERYLDGRADAQARRLRGLAEEARVLRAGIHNSARKCGYVAGRAAEWSHAQMQAMVRWATREDDTYGRPEDRARRPAPSVMDTQA